MKTTTNNNPATNKVTKIATTMDFYNEDGTVKQEYRAAEIANINHTNIKERTILGMDTEYEQKAHQGKPTKNRKVKECKERIPVEVTFANMDKAVQAQDINAYFEAGHELLCRKAIKLLQKINIVVEPKRYLETFAEARTICYEQLACWTAENEKYNYTRKEIGEDGVETTTTYEAWYELPAQMLFYVLSDGIQRQLRKYVFNADNLNNQVSLDSIAESASEEDLMEQIQLKVDRVGNIEYLQSILSQAQYRCLKEFIAGKSSADLGSAYRKMKKAIQAGRLNVDELRGLLPLIKSGDYNATQQADFETRKGLAQILRKLG